MATSTKKAPKERLTNEEFTELIPHLLLSELFPIKIKIQKNWCPMFVYLPKGQLVNCHVCKEKIPTSNFINHIKQTTHMNGLTKVEQFYHPVYTYDKKAIKLTKGELVSETEREIAIADANAALAQTRNEVWIQAKHLTKIIQKTCGVSPSSFEETLTSLALKTNATSAHDILVDVSLPLLELLKLEFSVKTDDWKPMLTTENPTPNGKFFCALCSKYCAGIITVNSHLNGFNHKNLQVETSGIRLIGREHLTKNCCFRFDKNYFLAVKREGRKLLKDKVLQILNECVDDQSNPSCVAEVAELQDQKRGSERNDKMEKKAQCPENANVDMPEGNNFETSFLSEKQSTELSVVVAAKAKALASEKPKIALVDDEVDTEIDGEGLIGVEYVIKLGKSPNDPAPEYECCLCEVVLNEARMQGHLIAYNHRLKYCEIHYPHTIQKFKEQIGHVKFTEFFRIMSFILSKMSQAIEKHHGRSIPYTIPVTKFAKLRPEIVARVYHFKHACESHGPSFLNAVSKKELMDVKFGKINYKIPTVPNYYRGKFTTIPLEKIYLNQRNHDPSMREEYKVKLETSIPSRSPDRRSHSPKIISSQRQMQERNIWKIYRTEISTAASDVERAYMEYRKYPESHPLYDQEWNRFWRQRKEELVSQGIDHRSYNYQPEWVLYFRERLEELFSEDLQKSKVDIRRRLNIPLDAEEDSKPETISVNILPAINSYKKQFHETEQSLKNIESSSKKRRLSQDYSTRQFNLHPNMTIEWKNADKHFENPEDSWLTYNSSIPYDSVNLLRKPVPMPNADEKPNVIHALRLLTALEDHLGSLGNKVMDLLSKALVLEKTSINTADLDRKILTARNCTLLETAMEKLKGILYAGLLDAGKVNGFNRVINHTTNILKYADRMGCRASSPDYTEKPSTTTEIQKLIEVLQNKQVNSVSEAGQKSLSDTLMELITAQKGESMQVNNLKQSMSNTPKVKAGETSFLLNSSNFVDPMSRFTSKNLQYNSARSNVNVKKLGTFASFDRNMVGSNSDNRFIRSNALVDNSGFQKNEPNQMSLANFDTNLTRNVEKNVNYRDNSTKESGTNFGQVSGSGRNFNNSNNNDSNNGNTATTFGNMKSSSSSSAFGGISQGFAFRGHNYSQAPNIGRGTNFYQNPMGNGSRSQNWNRFQNNNLQ